MTRHTPHSTPETSSDPVSDSTQLDQIAQLYERPTGIRGVAQKLGFKYDR